MRRSPTNSATFATPSPTARTVEHVWRVYRGSRSLLAMIVLGNLANTTLFSSTIPGPEEYLAGHPLMVVTLVAVQIVVTAVLIGLLASRTAPDVSTVGATPDWIESALRGRLLRPR